MKKKTYIITMLLFIALSSLFISCDESNPTSTVELSIALPEGSNGEKTILPNGVSLDIASYEITAFGPTEEYNKKTRVITNSKCVYENLDLGQWTFFVTAYNEEKTPIVTGDCTVELTALPASVNVDLDKFMGKGGLCVNFTWDSEVVKDPDLELELKYTDGRTEKVSPTTVEYSRGQASIEINKQKAGSYTLIAQLHDGNTNIAGCVEAIRILCGKVSEKTIHLNISDTSTVSEKKNSPLVINNTTGQPISCIITNVKSKIPLNSTVRPVLISKDGSPLTDYDLTWYLDGTLLGSGNNCSLKPDLGKHRLDVVVENKSIQGTRSSCNFLFEVTSNTPLYVPTLVSTIESGTDGINIGRDMKIEFLPDGKFLLYCGEFETLQICRVVNNSIEVLKTYKSSSRMPLMRVNDIAVSAKNNKVFITESATNSLTAYDYSYNQLTNLYRSDTYNNAATKMGNISVRAYDIFVDDPTSNAFRQYLLNPQTDEEKQDFAVSYAYNSKYGNFLCNTTSISPDLCSVLRTSTNGLTSFANIVREVEDLSVIPYAIPGPTFAMNEKINGAALSYNRFIISSKNKLSSYAVPNENTTSYVLKKEFKGGSNEIKSFESVEDFAFYTNISKIDASNIVDKMYALTRNSNSVMTFEINEGDYEMKMIGSVDLGDFIPSSFALSPNKENMIVVGENDHALKLLKIRTN